MLLNLIKKNHDAILITKKDEIVYNNEQLLQIYNV